MKLLTKEIEKKLPALYAQERDSDPIVQVKFFTPWTNWTWYATEATREETGDVLFFGLVEGHDKEWGYFRLSELESVRGRFGLRIERDRSFSPRRISEIRRDR